MCFFGIIVLQCKICLPFSCSSSAPTMVENPVVVKRNTKDTIETMFIFKLQGGVESTGNNLGLLRLIIMLFGYYQQNLFFTKLHIVNRAPINEYKYTPFLVIAINHTPLLKR